ncbi:hypothetical protein DMR58_24070 [Salmonella enterica]|nr:hypothetical protein [Salmonella enterica]MFE40474.1 hypothetical protein [Salmonella enterica]
MKINSYESARMCCHIEFTLQKHEKTALPFFLRTRVKSMAQSAQGPYFSHFPRSATRQSDKLIDRHGTVDGYPFCLSPVNILAHPFRCYLW